MFNLVSSKIGEARSFREFQTEDSWYVNTVETLVATSKLLSSARDMTAVTAIVRHAARALTNADGATFVLREGNQCYYVDEDAVQPLWKGQRFPMSICISGWVMLNAMPVVIEDVFRDPRIPGEVYSRTFVKSMAMVPIRLSNPIGAIGAYWAQAHGPNREEMWALQSLADITSLAIENMQLYALLQEKLEALEGSNRELGRFAWMLSNDLKEPLNAIERGAQILEEETNGQVRPATFQQVKIMRQRVERMRKKLDNLLEYAQLEKNMDDDDVGEELGGEALLQRTLSQICVPPNFHVTMTGDASLMRVQRLPLQQIMSHLIENAIMHHDSNHGRVTVDVKDERLFYRISVIDDGPGIPAEQQAHLFDMSPGTNDDVSARHNGMGLALVKKVLLSYGGGITATALGERGMAFTFTWPKPLSQMMCKDKKEEWA